MDTDRETLRGEKVFRHPAAPCRDFLVFSFFCRAWDTLLTHNVGMECYKNETFSQKYGQFQTSSCLIVKLMGFFEWVFRLNARNNV